MSSVHSALVTARSALSAVTDNASREAEDMLCHLLGWDRLKLFMENRTLLNETAAQKFEAMVARRIEGEPLQYLLGHAGFMGLDFLVRPGVLIPRPDTELLVEMALSHLKALEQARPSADFFKVADLGTGSGAIALSIAHYNEASSVTAVDLSPQALAVAEENVRRLGLDQRVRLIEADMFDFLAGAEAASFDLIASNPPYIPTQVIESLQVEVRVHEPRLALDGGPDGLGPYRRLAVMAHRPLVSGGRLVMEIGHDQAAPVKQFLLDAGVWEKVECIRDLQGNDRVVTAVKSRAAV
ncbi:peptide chain release factor N(5)-glutamine methyltransferase [Acidaminobacter sp.]|uniref:peptide chain release factor N(5)-glutamine methyltransferase n=1 Tax=Acidaminobacter sp. TaxID=1872102 RepID=UPI0013864299|nr:peptide chain release factor N(5)-glutamine methyltransferase [Acidaminobacter sp.]MDK9711761.1 peptide chain release factor N(5)-glutamine methyltransferase [Acidaminobacter sp.]MZQ96462.1 peptide chain release factor N(5)-glutamine methyltransferase [Acidaminobacter sp.]